MRTADAFLSPTLFQTVLFAVAFRWQWHPFSVSSASTTSSKGDECSWEHHIKDMGEGTWTAQLRCLVQGSAPAAVAVAGEGAAEAEARGDAGLEPEPEAEPEPQPEPEPKPLVAPQAVELQDLSIEVASRSEPEPDPNASVEVSKPSPEPALSTAAAATASAAPTFTVHCHGPYGAAPFSLPASEDAVLFYVGGIGITPAASCVPHTDS